MRNLKTIPLNPFNFCSIHSEGINFSLGQLNILRTFYIPSVVAKNGKLRERIFVPGLDGTAQPVSKVKKGTALSKDEEKTLIEFCKANPHYQANDAMLVLVYTGMRIGELASITYDDTYITCISEKTRRGQKGRCKKDTHLAHAEKDYGDD